METRDYGDILYYLRSARVNHADVPGDRAWGRQRHLYFDSFEQAPGGATNAGSADGAPGRNGHAHPAFAFAGLDRQANGSAFLHLWALHLRTRSHLDRW